MTRRLLVICLLYLPLLACSQSIDSTSYLVAKAKLGQDLTAVSNPEGSFVLFTNEDVNEENNLPRTRYVVVRALDKKVVEEGSVTMSKLSWSGNYDLEVLPMKGQVQLQRTENSTVRKIDLRKHIGSISPK